MVPTSDTLTGLADLVADTLLEGPQTRKQLAERLGVSRTTLSRALAGLLADGFVEAGGLAESGRVGRPVEVLRLNTQRAYAVGIDVTRRDESAVLIDRCRRELATARFRLQPDTTWAQAAASVGDALRAAASEAGVDCDHVAGVGVGLPIPVGEAHADAASREVVATLEKQWHAPVLVDNCVRMVAQGEVRPDVTDLLYIALNAGVGACVISGGRPLRGVRSLAGELGHFTLPGATTPCYCGLTGCLETVAGLVAVTEAARCRDLAELAETRTAQAQAAIAEAASAVATAALPVILALSPTEVVIGGELAYRVPAIVAAIEEAINAHLPPTLEWTVPVRAAERDVTARAWGALAALLAHLA